MDWFLYDSDLRHERVKNPVKHLRWRGLRKRILAINSFRKTLHLRCSTNISDKNLKIYESMTILFIP